MIISQFCQSEERARLLSLSAQNRLHIVTTFVVNFAQLIFDGSIGLADFRELTLKEDKFVELATHCLSSTAAPAGTTSSNAPPHNHHERLHRSFAECRSRLERYENQNKRVEFFVEKFRSFPQIGTVFSDN